MSYKDTKEIALRALKVIEGLDDMDSYQKSETLAIAQGFVELELRRIIKEEQRKT